MNTVFVDVDTQIDFLFPAGALYAPGAERIVPAIARLNRHAARTGTIVLSSMDAHAESDPEFANWPPHCVVGTVGQQKPAVTLLERRITVPSVRGAVFSLDSCQQILVEKQHLDVFTNPNLADVLEHLRAQRFVVYGVVTEICVRFAAFGLLQRGKLVEVVTDAVCSLDDAKARQMFADFTAAGGKLTSAAAVAA
ncbi:MAG TPA: isochorismatase family cysteine hydrolase [Bryobacteraceae bacterium]|nr:isochorismatase family cysteine hydrolase [Bryobacteraceae bacterium]